MPESTIMLMNGYRHWYRPQGPGNGCMGVVLVKFCKQAWDAETVGSHSSDGKAFPPTTMIREERFPRPAGRIATIRPAPETG